jgi:hypothetical protein
MKTQQITVYGIGDLRSYDMSSDFSNDDLKLKIEDDTFIPFNMFNLVGDGDTREVVIQVMSGMRAKWKKKRMRRLKRKRRKMRQRAR